MKHTAQIKLAAESEELRIVWAEIYVPNMPDSDGEYMDAETIRKMAYQFMADGNLKKIDVQHNNELVPGAVVVESFIARKGDPDFIPDSWVAGIHINHDVTWGKIKKGEINGFSLEAMVIKHPDTSEVEIDIPPVLQGVTQKSEDHEHLFYVSYDDQGNFRGGVTSVTDGHSHRITKGTVTEASKGHTHRFSHIEHLYQQ